MTTSVAPWRALRFEFPAAVGSTYLNTGAAAPLSRRAAEEAARYFDELMREGDAAWPRWAAQREHVRRQLAALLHADPEEVAFSAGASDAFERLAAMLGPAGHVVAAADEFPRVVSALRRYGDEMVFVPPADDGTIRPGDVEAAITPHTRAVLASAVMYASGFRQDLGVLGAICARRGLPLIVDASQSVGLVDIDVHADGIGALAFAGYKGIMGGHGSGAVYVSRAMLESPTASRWWEARDTITRSRPTARTAAALLEPALPAFASIFAMGGSLALLQELGMSRVEARIHELTDYLHDTLDANGFEIASPRARVQRAAITIVRAAGGQAVARALAAAGIIVTPHRAGIRVSVHVFNLEADLDRLVDALVAIREGRELTATPAAEGPLVCVDLNGVLDAYRGWQGPEHWDPPATGARGFLAALRDRGCRVVVFTTRHYRGVWTWLCEHGLDDLVSDVTSMKPPADVFVDDRAVLFRGDFAATLREIDAFIPHWDAPASRT